MSWQLYAALACAGFFLLAGGRRAKKKKKKSGGKGGFLLTAIIAGAVLAAAGGGGAAVTAVKTIKTTHLHGSNVAIGQRLAAAYGWGSGREWDCLYTLWDHESGWVIQWNHAGSGAFGIPQALPASKMASAGADYMTNPATQIKWGLGYIKGRYGTPCGAWGQYCSHPPPNRCWY